MMPSSTIRCSKQFDLKCFLWGIFLWDQWIRTCRRRFRVSVMVAWGLWNPFFINSDALTHFPCFDFLLDIPKEIEDVEDLSMIVMETRADISTKTTPAAKFAPSETTTPSLGQSGQQAIPSTFSRASPSSAHAEHQEIPSPSLEVSSAGFSQAVPPTTPVVQTQPIGQAKLPKLILPRFRGEITHWITFCDSYDSAVHNNPASSKVDKFNYLNSLLEGEAKGSIQGLNHVCLRNDEDSNSYRPTPSDLIYGRRISTNPNASHQEIMSTYQSLTRRLHYHKNLLQQLTNQWRKEYLTNLRERGQPQAKDNNKEGVSVGDIVVLKNDSTSRIYWKLAKVEELIYSADGNLKARAAIVKVATTPIGRCICR